jgi:gamma-glutamylcyclotransferase
MSNSLLYFAYGSNMSIRRLRQRLPAATAVMPVSVPGYEIVFHKRGRLDDSGKCGLLQRPGADAVAHGVLYEILFSDLLLLDTIEGLGNGYERCQISLDLPELGPVLAFSYLATNLDSRLQPFHWYKQHVLTGAREHNLPQAYIQRIEALESVDDPDPARQARELAIYTQR